MSAFVLSKIFPSMNIDANQRFIFGLEGSPEPLGSFKLDNIYIPLIGSPSQTNYEMRNQALSGYRWIHTTQSTETYGSLKLQRFLTGSFTGIDIMTFNDDGSFIIPGFNDAKYIIQQPDTNLPNAQTLSTLTTGLLKNTTTTGVLSIALPGIDYLPMSGGTLTGDLILNGDPANPLGAVTRQYADAISQGLNFKNSCYVGTTSNLTATYANGTSGVGATLTNSGTLAVFSVDGVTPPLNSRILVKDQTSGFQNGIYTLTNVGSVSIAWVLTRASDYNQTVEIKPGDFVIVDNGTINTRTGWVQTATINTIGTDNLTFSAFGTVGTAPNSAKYIIQTADSSLPNAQVLGSLVGGILKNTNITGVLSIAIPAIDYFAPDVNSNLNLNSHKVVNLLDPTNAQDAATKAYVDSAIDNTFGPSVALPFVQLDFNWNNASGSDPFIFNNYLVNTSPSLRQYVHRVSAISGGTRKWEVFYDLGDPTTPHGIIQFQFSHPAGSPVDFVPFKIEIFGPSWNPFIYINATLSLNGILDMGAHRIENVAAPVFDQDAVNKLYVTNTINTSINASTLTLTGSVTGSGNINGSLATSFSNIQTVSGNTQTFNYSNALTSSIFSLTNTNPSAVTRFRASGGASGDYVELVYDAFNGYSYINLANASNDRLVFMTNGTPLAALLYTGLFGIGTITPTSAKLQINGGVQNIANEETAIRVIGALNSIKIELQNTSASGHLWELRSNSNGSLDVIDRTSAVNRFIITSSGNVGINMGVASTNAPLQLPATVANRKIVLYEAVNNDHQFYGFGINAGILRYQIYDSAGAHVFYCGVNSTTSNEVGRLSGTGDFTLSGVNYSHGPFGLCYFAGNAVTTSVTAGVYTKMLGVTTISAVGLSQFSMPANNRLQYNGTPTGFFKISAIVSVQHNQILGASVSIALYKNGVQLVPSIMTGYQGASAQSIILNTSDIINLSTGDYVEIYLTASANATLTPAYATLIITST